MSEVDRSGWIVYTRESLGLPIIATGPRPRPIRARINGAGCHICVSHCPRQRQGYPVISIAGRDVNVGTVLYELRHGKLSPGLLLRHRCDDPWCINVEHLEPGTEAQNSRDMVQRGRSTKGSRNGNSRLTEEQVRAIKASNGISAAEWARRLGVAKFTVLSIWRGITWRHVDGDGLHEKRVGNRKLTEEQVRWIRSQPHTPLRDLAAALGVTTQAVSLIRTGRNWKKVEGEKW